ncbi:MAG: nucleotide exchange factor GrpE [Buchnera aphidicola (Nurudea yanoniella)]
MNDKSLDNDNFFNNVSKKRDDVTSKEKISSEKINILNKELKILEEKISNKKLLSKEKIKLYRNRANKEIENAYKFSLNDFISALLPVVDNVECSLNLLKENDTSLDSICVKLENILSDFLKLLKKCGLKTIYKSNIPFNPDVHQAMATQHSKNIEENHIISVMQKGYLLNGRLLRPAMVIVSKL